MGHQKLTPVIATGSSELRYVADRFADCFCVKDFGAVGDAITDDTAALSAALSCGGKLVFEKGKTYKVTSTIYVENSGLNADLNGCTIAANNGSLIVFAPSDSEALEYNGLRDIRFANGTIKWGSIGIAHNKNVVVENVSFLDSKGQHHIQIFASSNVHIKSCYFCGLMTSSSGNPHYESINIDPGDYTAFPYFSQDSITYDSTKNSNIFVDSCLFENGTGDYANLDDCVGTHYNDSALTLHDCIVVSNCVMKGVNKWAVRANSWKNSKICNCYIETNQFALDVGYQQRAENITFSDCMIVQKYNENNDAPIHFGPYRCGNICISNVKYKDSSGTVETLGDFTLSASAASGASDKTFSPNFSSDIIPLKSGGSGSSLGTENNVWSILYAAQVAIKKANPYLIFTETDVEKGVPVESIGFQGIYFEDKNGTELGKIIFQMQGSENVYNTLSLTHNGNGDTSDPHSVFIRQSGTDDTWYFAPSPSNTISLGQSEYLWKNIYCSTSSITTSDKNLKQNVSSISDDILKAWDDVEFKLFKYKDAVDDKHSSARIHVGLIAQDIKEAFRKNGVDESRYGLFCRDVIADESGEQIERFGLRYSEALALECASLRKKIEKMQKKIDALSATINKLER